MISLIGTQLLWLALILAIINSVLGMAAKQARFHLPILVGTRLCFLLISFAYSLLIFAFITHDFKLSYVAANSHPQLALVYRISATWAAHEGSLLLWIWILSVWMIIFASHKTVSSVKTPTLAFLNGLLSLFLIFLLLSSNPFLAANTAFESHDLNPLLHDPGLLIHPPLLYLGYVGFSVCFALALTALFTQNFERTIIHLIRNYTIAAWCGLSIGILLGSWWAYRVLGWGGFWFWDPVENASLLPWLSSIALMHLLVLTEKRGVNPRYCVLLALITFILSILGTLLARSGMLISVHSFATDSTRGVFLLGILGIVLLASVSAYLFRIKQQSYAPSPVISAFYSRDLILWLNVALFLLALLSILLGTLYPVLIEALGLGKISVGAPYFNAVMLPLACVCLFVMGIAPLSSFSSLVAKHQQKYFLSCFISVIAAYLMLWGIIGETELLSILCLSLSCFILLTTYPFLKFNPGMTLAHIGFAMLILGVLLSNILSQEKEVLLKTGDYSRLGPYLFLFEGTRTYAGTNYTAIRARFSISKNERLVSTLYPEQRYYPVRNSTISKVAIHPSIFRDLYIALAEPLNHNFWHVRFYYKPFISFIWFGGVLMLMGALMAIKRKVKIR